MRIVQQDEYENTTVTFMHGEVPLMQVNDCFIWPALHECIVIEGTVWYVREVVMDYVADNRTHVTVFVITQASRERAELEAYRMAKRPKR